MMKLNKKSVAAIAFLAVLCVGVAYAAYTVYSPNVEQKLDYEVTIKSVVKSGSVITIIAHVTDNGNPLGGAKVGFYYTSDGGATWNYIGYQWSDGSGDTSPMVWNAPGNGDYYFQAQYTVP